MNSICNKNWSYGWVVVMRTFNYYIQKAKADGALWVQCQAGLQSSRPARANQRNPVLKENKSDFWVWRCGWNRVALSSLGLLPPWSQVWATMPQTQLVLQQPTQMPLYSESWHDLFSLYKRYRVGVGLLGGCLSPISKVHLSVNHKWTRDMSAKCLQGENKSSNCTYLACAIVPSPSTQSQAPLHAEFELR